MQCVNGLIGVLHIFLVVITPIYAQYRYGDIRLVGGSYQWEGRVEIFISGTWGTITDSEWTNNDAQVVCRKLGHFRPGATAHTGAYFGEGSGPIHLDFVQCSGSEYNLTECEIRNDHIRSNYSSNVGVKCQPADEAYRKGDIRLVGGSYNWEGRVEIYWTGTWGTISDTSWSDSDAEVVCRQLEHSTNDARGYYENSTGEIYIQEVNCFGLERNITSCSYTINTVVTSHSNDVAVTCQRGDDIKVGNIRLIPGSYLWQGLVEIFLDGVWGTINRVGAYTYDARVVCRQLGYNTFSVGYGHGFRQLGEVIHITDLDCSGSEYRITECGYSGHTMDLSHHDDWNIYCHVDGPETGDINLISGYLKVFLSGSWEPVTDTSRSWTIYNSEVVCRQLGYTGTSTYNPPNYYTGRLSTMKGLIDHVDCIGTESKVIDCSHNINLQSYYTSPRLDCPEYDCGDGDIRLVNGTSELEGRVEICQNGRWGTVCDSQWTDHHTAVVCRQLGFSDIIGDSTYFTSKRFGEGSGPVFIDFIDCNGSESMLWGSDRRSLRKCSSFTHYYGCSHSDDVGVRCQPASCSDGQIRLIESCYSDSEGGLRGRVAICSNQRWETISDDYWGINEALVACNALGYDDGDYRCCLCGRSGSPMHQKHFQCRGTELDLSQCTSYGVTSQPQDQGVGISCFGDCTDGEVRLVGGESEFEGRVEMCLNNRWGTVSSDGWTQTNTEVVCNDLGYDYNGAVVNLFIPRALSKPVYLHNVVCSSTDLNLMGCSFSKYPGHISDVQQTIISCQQPLCRNGDLKLVGGRSEDEGRLEVCFDQRWGTINGDGWTHADTQVACRQLGHSTSDVTYTRTWRSRDWSSASLPVHLTAVGCYGSEEKLIDCAHHNYTSSLSRDISISCSSSDSGESEASSVSAAALSIAVIFAFVVIVLAAVLIIVLLKQKKKAVPASNQLGTGLMNQNADKVRYATGGSIDNTSIDANVNDPLLHDDPMDDHRDDEVDVRSDDYVTKSA